MNIIEAREAALAGKTVIDCLGEEWDGHALENSLNRLSTIVVFGEWRVKQEPVIFSADVLESKLDKGLLLLNEQSLSQFIGKRVKITVEVLP